MSKRAEGAALKAYPPTYTTVKRYAKRVQSELVDTHHPARAIFQQGYEQAEKDLALSWEDVRKLCSLSFVVEVDLGREISDKQHYEEVLRRFIESKNK